MDDFLEPYRDEIDRQSTRVEAIETLYDEIAEQRKATVQAYRDTVVEALEQLQAEIDDHVTLLEVQERGRMSFDYQEVLTPDGVMTDGSGYHDWDDTISVDEYLDRHYRGTREHVDLLAERLTTNDQELPTIQYPIHS